MPNFNALGNRAFSVPPKKIVLPSILPENWLERLFQQFDNHLNASHKNTIKEHFQTRHLHKYLLKDELKNALAIIYQKWFPLDQSDLTLDEKKSITLKILQAAPICSEGAHNHINEIITPWQYVWSIDTLLHQFRQSIVTSAAYKETDNVHAHKDFFMIAHQQGFGVEANNPNDPYSGGIADVRINWLLIETMEQLYHPLHILSFLIDEIKRACLTHYEYKGVSAEGYDYGQYHAWFNLVLEPLLNKELDYAELLVAEEDKIIDIDWTQVTLHLINKLQEDEVFYLDPPTYSALFYLMDREQPAQQGFDLCELLMFSNATEYFLCLFKLISDKEKKHQLFEAFYDLKINQKTRETESIRRLAKIYFSDALKDEKALQEDLKTRFNTRMDKVIADQSPNYFISKFMYKPPKEQLFKEYLLAVKLAEPHHKEEILKATYGDWNIVTYAAYVYPKVLSEVLTLVKELPILEQEQLFFNHNRSGWLIFGHPLALCNTKVIDQITHHIASVFPFETQMAICSQQAVIFLSLIKQYKHRSINPTLVINAISEFLPEKEKKSHALSVFYASDAVQEHQESKQTIEKIFTQLAASPLHHKDPRVFVKEFFRKPPAPDLFKDYLGYLQMMTRTQKNRILKATHLSCNVLILTLYAYPDFLPDVLKIIETLEVTTQEKIFLHRTSNKVPMLLCNKVIDNEIPSLFRSLSKLPAAFQTNLYLNFSRFFWKYVVSESTSGEVIDQILTTLAPKNEIALGFIQELLKTINNPKLPISQEKKQAVLHAIYKKQPLVLMQELDLFSRPQENQSTIINFYQKIKTTFNLYSQNERPINVDQTFFALSKVLKLEADIIKNQKTLQTKHFGLFSKSTRELRSEILKATEEQHNILQDYGRAEASVER